MKGGGERFGFGRGRLEPRAAGCIREDARVEELHVSYVEGGAKHIGGMPMTRKEKGSNNKPKHIFFTK